MAVQIKRGKRSFLVGMEWELAQDKTDAKALLKRAGAKARIMLSPQGDDRAWIGYAERGQKGLATAALVAEVLGDVIVAAPAQAGRTWLCATSQGMPIPSRDVVIASEEVRDTLLEWMSYYPSASLYGDVNGAIGSVDDMWTRLEAAQDNGDLSKRRLKQLQVITPASTKDKLVLLGMVALIGGGLAGWHFFIREKPLTPQELAKRRAAGQALQSAAAERMRKEAP
ncbi:MAG TPA: type 4b pilus protein PilO2, partial [Xanthomonadales bacterium]|nr:type 4b pilus protein PilO2 [Xanthomonadales bacterium]